MRSSPISGKVDARIARELDRTFQCESDLQEESVAYDEVETRRETSWRRPNETDFFREHQKTVVVI